MKTSQRVFLNTIHGLFLGFSIGMTASILVGEFYPAFDAYLQPEFIYPVFSVLGAIIGFIKGYQNKGRLLNFLFSTAGTILTPLILFSLTLYFIGLEEFLSLPPMIFKNGLGLPQLDTQLTTYILAFLFALGAVASFISSLSINKRKRWTW